MRVRRVIFQLQNIRRRVARDWQQLVATASGVEAGKESMIGHISAAGKIGDPAMGGVSAAGKIGNPAMGGVSTVGKESMIGDPAARVEARTFNVIRIIKPRFAAVVDAAIIQPKSRKRCQREVQSLTLWKGGVSGCQTRRSPDDDPLNQQPNRGKKRN